MAQDYGPPLGGGRGWTTIIDHAGNRSTARAPRRREQAPDTPASEEARRDVLAILSGRGDGYRRT